MDKSFLTSPDIAAPQTRVQDLRIGNLFCDDYAEARIVIVGFPHDEGVRRNGGRVGAASAPDEIRKQLYKFCPDPGNGEFLTTVEATMDAGNVTPSSSLEDTQEKLATIVGSIISDNKIPIILGGGHETSYGHFLGYVNAGRDVSIINLDAHPDVRPLIDGKGHSGSPFRQAAEHSAHRLKKYTVMGLQRHAVALNHIQYLEKSEFPFSFRDKYDLVAWSAALAVGSCMMVTFDMDAMDGSIAPGVSAPSVNGLSSRDFLEAAYAAGVSPNVHSIDVVEVNPAFDIDNRTARLAAVGIWNFLRGVSDRTESE